VDADVFVAALLGPGGAAREVVRRCIAGDYQPLIGLALFLEYEALLSRDRLRTRSRLNQGERRAVLAAFLQACRWTEIYYGWRPNLKDESDNHLVELGVAGNAAAIVTRNRRDFAGAELRFPALRIVTPTECLKEYPCRP
jgi:predicted nucleic acid-binding protein